MVCHRPLSNPESVKRGIGPVCAGRVARYSSSDDKREDFIADRVEGFLDDRVVLRRDPDGTVVTNVPHRNVYHSPCGYEWGYGGSGPADLALNILMAILPENEAWNLHQDFKWKFVAPMPREGGTIHVSVIREWIALKRREV
jgi:hypothetical protein